jgi:hypothetical protein
MFFATRQLRRKDSPPFSLGRDLTTEQVIAHVQRVTLLALEGRQK